MMAEPTLSAHDGKAELASHAAGRTIRAAMQLGAGVRGGDGDGGGQDGDELVADAERRDDPAGEPAADAERRDEPSAPPVGADDPTRTSAPHDGAAATSPPADRDDRLPAPLQYRDPARYQIIDEHGRGGLGRVLRARDKELGRQVAVKELLRRGATSELRFFREALITARLEHPGIVPVHEAGRWPDGTPFYAMKLVQGRPLRELIDECQAPADRVALLPHVVAVADAIAYAHDRKIIHRDLKPSNVIVGAFGETVVIDWGLAKDLTDQIADPVDDGPYRSPAASGLTVAGSVLGTPAYMAPEQRDGRADERADIYALGGILYHLLAGEPPHRDGIAAPAGGPPALPRAVPRDLAAIVTRAMAADPAARYASAADLAADLRRFAQRRPVAARRYSLAGRALLGFARHRAVSVVLVAALTALSVVLALAASRISNQRFVAVEAKTEAQSQRDRAEKALDDMTLQHAESLLATDPSEAMDVLATYHGTDQLTVERIRAEARGLGVALLRARPVLGNVMWTQGAVGRVFTLGYGGTIEATVASGRTETIARNGTVRRAFAFSGPRALLAYACNAHDVCLIDLAHQQPVPGEAGLRGLAPISLAFSPDGKRLAVLTERGQVQIWDVSGLVQFHRAQSASVASATSIEFTGEGRLAIASPDRLELLDRDGENIVAYSGDAVTWSVDPVHHWIAVGGGGGRVAVGVVGAPWQDIWPAPCADAVAFLRWLPHQSAVGIACQDGTIETWDAKTHVTTRRGHVDGTPTAIASSFDGTLLIIGSSSGAVLVVDLATRLATTFRGHRATIASVAGPTPDWPLITTSDKIGWVRTWSPPRRAARLLVHFDSELESLGAFGPPTAILVSHNEKLARVSPSGDVEEFSPHVGGATYFEESHDGNRLVAAGFGGAVEVWDARTLVRRYVLHVRDESVEGMGFLADNKTVVTAGHGGAVLAWSTESLPRLVLRLSQPITGMWILYPSDELVIVSMDGGLWVSDVQGRRRAVLGPGDEILRLVPSNDDRFLVTGDASGLVMIFDAASWSRRKILRAQAAVWSLAISPDHDIIAAATRNGFVYIARAASPGWQQSSWTQYQAYANDLVFAPSGDLLLAPGPEGLWVYDVRRRRECRLSLPTLNLDTLRVAPDGTGAAVIAQGGKLVWIDLARLRADCAPSWAS
jgi:eukaryotic-like serine/threonine-protein kinase